MNHEEKAAILTDLERRFKYHPPKTQERIDAHDTVNNSAKHFAQSVLPLISDPVKREQIYFLIQQARMFCNQEITFQEEYGDS